MAVIRLNRPEKHNAVNDAVMDHIQELQTVLQKREDILVLILTGAGEKYFCAGGDIKYFAALRTREDAEAMSRRMQAILNAFRMGNQVVIAAVNGNALGGGCEILTACHYRIASAHAQFSFRQAANGIITGWGGGVRLFRQIGASRALRLLTTADTVNASEALDIGFIEEVVSGERVLPSALSLADSITRNSHGAVRAFLRVLQSMERCDSEAVVEYETERFGDLWTGYDFKLWLSNFLKNSSSS